MNAKRILLSFLAICSLCLSYAQKLSLNEQGYYEKRGVNVLVYSNQYNGMFFDEKTAGVEIIHHGVRTVTGGAVRLQNTPEQWDLVPDVVSRTINKDGSIDVVLNYPDFNFTSSIKVFPKGNGFVIDVILDKPVPEKLVGKAGFNMEFLPSAYFEKSYIADNKPYYFPRYPSGKTMMKSSDDKIHQIFNHTTFDDRGRNEYIVPLPLATGKDITLAPEDMQRTIKLQSDSTISLYDGRNLAQNGWFIARSILPVNKTGKVLEWYVEPLSVSDWVREPNIGFSQIGYCPNQKKVSVIELDPNDNPLQDATLYNVNSNGESTVKLTADLKKWGKYLRYNYFTFDFSSVKDEGVYYIQYGKTKTNTFVISKDVFKDIWHPTLDVWFPVQMDHMEVNEAYRVWHGVPYLDDALQAPVNEKHFDGYSMGPTTDTKYKPYERIPGLNVGGWFDAGDFDIQTGSHDSALLSFTDAWENFKVDRDETFVDQKTRYVDIHRPDGKPDLLQQIEHGALNVVAQVKNIGHPVRGIVVPNLHQYHHLGDAADITDNLPYNPNLKPYESDGKSSGTMDDRWAFTNRMPMLDLQTAAALAASYRALKDYNPSLADDCLTCAKKLWEDSKDEQMSFPRFEGMPLLRHFRMDTQAALELYISTREKKYLKRFTDHIWESLDFAPSFSISYALQACPYMDKNYIKRLRKYVIKCKVQQDSICNENPYGVPLGKGMWAGNESIIDWAITNYYANKYFPDIINKDNIYSGIDYIMGCHPYSNLSFVASVGTKSKKVTYGNNRADFSFIAGGVVPGVMLLKPDFFENKDDWPFFWGENECTVGACASYIFLGNALDNINR